MTYIRRGVNIESELCQEILLHHVQIMKENRIKYRHWNTNQRNKEILDARRKYGGPTANKEYRNRKCSQILRSK
jgi:hypothetical protein